MHSTKDSDHVKEATCKDEQPVNQAEKRRVEESEEEEEELDEFGRVKRRRQKFKSERDPAREEGEYDDEDDIDDYEDDRYARRRRRSRHRESSPYRRRRSSSRHRSSSRRCRSTSRRRSYHRSSSRYGYSGSESDDDDYYRRRRRPSYHRDSRYHYRGRSRDTYDHAGRYIDTEFYSTKVYIGDLEGVSRDGLERAFSRYGSIREIKMVEGKDYAFVTFEDKTSALDAIQGMHGVLLGSRNIKVNRAKIPERNQVGFGNVPWTDEDGNLAKEEMQSYPASRDMLSLAASGEDLNTQPPVGRALTSYDDL
ncbi:hypothetical protein RO3G_09035 [Lichtheimia corymbifera JMRC:FSU:9682]|uniref:RRM domain-containing protein n=1 Tax=Lichtheimia corymbifera JMRC:FSU:9682 TaxID=1263082 RepID=A0A068RMN4_9FUNG|nr:hypothetical protein RO3G_09035 [Lichtheimia corymbifera JMRC:FSU:9682]